MAKSGEKEAIPIWKVHIHSTLLVFESCCRDKACIVLNS
jgi:hypothetical protein